jgi:cyanophycinase-like exopeptidase
MVVAGEWMYDPGANLAVTSAEAVADPYRTSVILNNTDLFGLAQGFNLIPEPHFANRDRMGRLLAFMARLRQDARSSLIYGVGLDEGTSLFIDANNVGSFQRQVAGVGSGYILAEDRRATQRVQVAPGKPLIYRKVQRVKLAPGQSYDFARGLATQPGSVINVEGVVPPNPY